MKNLRFVLSENFQFLEVKFSIYLNRRVFIMSLYFMRSMFSRATFIDFIGCDFAPVLKGLDNLGTFSAIIARETTLMATYSLPCISLRKHAYSNI